MKKINIVKKNSDYNRIIKENRPYKYKDYIIYKERTNDNTYHFGFSVSKKICNAVNRNRIKRQLKDILDQKIYQNNFNCIIMVKRGILDRTYQEMQENLFECLEHLNILKESDDEK